MYVCWKFNLNSLQQKNMLSTAAPHTMENNSGSPNGKMAKNSEVNMKRTSFLIFNSELKVLHSRWYQ